MKKSDLILFFSIIAASICIYIFVFASNGESGDLLRITINGELYGEYDLSVDSTIEIENSYGKNIIVIEDGAAYMSYADCPDGYCVKTGAVDSANETIVCLPHRLALQLISTEGTEDAPVDIIG